MPLLGYQQVRCIFSGVINCTDHQPAFFNMFSGNSFPTSCFSSESNFKIRVCMKLQIKSLHETESIHCW